MKTAEPDMPSSIVNDPREIASIKRGKRGDILGWPVQGAAGVYWYAYDWSLERYRERQRRKAKLSWWQRMLAWVRGFWSRESDKHE